MNFVQAGFTKLNDDYQNKKCDLSPLRSRILGIGFVGELATASFRKNDENRASSGKITGFLPATSHFLFMLVKTTGVFTPTTRHALKLPHPSQHQKHAKTGTSTTKGIEKPGEQLQILEPLVIDVSSITGEQW